MYERNGKRIVYAASSSCYGIPKKYPTSEKESCDPKYPYAFSKYIGEKLLHHWSKVYGINYISLRFSMFMAQDQELTEHMERH